MADPLTTIATYWSLEDYAVQRTALDAAGIDSVADDHFIININWLNANALHGIKLRVAEADAEGARDVLAGASEIGEPAPFSECGGEAAALNAAALPPHPESCPLCGSDEIYRGLQRRRRAWMWYMLCVLPILTPRLLPVIWFAGAALIAIPLTEEIVCRNCGLILPNR